MGLGIILDYQFDFSSSIWITLFAISSLGYLMGEVIYRKWIKSHAYNLSIIGYLALILCFGATWHSFFDYRELPSEAKVLNTYTWEELIFEGTIQQIKQTGTGKYQIDIDVDTTIFPGDLHWPKSYKVRAILSPHENTNSKDLVLGRSIIFSATVYPLEEKRNPSQFNYKQYLASKGIYTQVGIKEIQYLPRKDNRTLSWPIIRNQVLNAIDNNFSPETSSLAKALLIGNKNELERDEQLSFSRAGLSHIMAVSGLHVGFILAPFWIIIPFFWTLRYGRQIGLTLLIAMLYLYAGLTDFSSSVARASLVGLFLAYGKLFHQIRNSKNLTAVAALLLLLINPSDLFSIGFQLSFGAVYVILLTAPVIHRWIPNAIRFRWTGKSIMVIIISFIVQAGIFPLLAYYFGEFSLVGPFANAIVIPFLGIAVPLALLLLPLAMLLPKLAHLLNTPIDLFLSWLSSFVDATADLPWSWIDVHIESILLFGIWATGILFISSLPIPRIRWKLLAILLMIITIDQGHKVIQKLKPATLQLTFFDVGQGDAALIRTPGDKYFLIDTGRWQPDYNSANYVITPFLKQGGIKKLDGLFLSHPHADHIGGIIELIESIRIDTIYNSGVSYDSQLYKSYHRKAEKFQIPIISLQAGDQVSIDPSIRIFVYGPMNKSANSNVNNHSLILELLYGETEFLFMGDAEKVQENRLIDNFPQMIDTDFLKVAHHGSKTSSTSRLLQATSPQTGLVSLSKQNRFQHPHKQATQRLHRHIPNIHFTSLEGAAQYYSDGYNIYEY